MYSDLLDEQTIAINDIYLDPNNPRFWTERTTKDVSETKIPAQDVQARTLTAIQQHGVEELRDNILRNGFLPLDRIVVRPIGKNPGKYVVVEGNRRLAALKSLRQQIADDLISEEHITPEYLSRLRAATDNIEVLVYKGTDTADIAGGLKSETQSRR